MSHTNYSLVDFGHGQRLEQWGQYRIVRPDPEAEAATYTRPEEWEEVDAAYEGPKGQGKWVRYTEVPEQWLTDFDDLQLITSLTPYKHTGIFPEQQVNWNWARARGQGRSLRILNLFAYTGGATMALAKDGHFVTHVDASKPVITWAKQNAEQNHIAADKIRWMPEDAALFVARELKRGKTYDAIILDPPAYGHSPVGKAWRIERDLAPLLENCVALLSSEPAFLILNGYAQHDTSESFHRLLSGIFHSKLPGREVRIQAEELALACSDGRLLSTGITARCKFGV